jgi:SAM-dependent methyltransferase
VGPSSFYDDIAELYDLIYADWEGSMRRHGAAISAMLGRTDGSGARILDVSAGIGTQALPLAALGYEVVARDLSAGAIARLRREAESRGLALDADTADMRSVGGSVSGSFDAVIAFDNSVPHLLSDAEIADALRGFADLLVEGGALLISVRDYGLVDRRPTSFHSYGERKRGGRTFRLGQAWKWLDAAHYDTTMIIEREENGVWNEVVRTEARYYAIAIERLLALMRSAGLEAERVADVPFFQPVLRGRRRNWRVGE